MQTRRRRRGNRPPVNTENALSVTNENPEFCSLFHWHVDKTARCVDLRPTISEALLRKTKRNIKLLRTTGKRSLWAWHAAADRFIDAFLGWCCAILYIHTIHTLIQLHRLTHSALRIYSMQILIFPITLSSQHSIVRLYIIMFEQHRINLPSPRMKMMMMQPDAMNEEKTETNGQTSYSCVFWWRRGISRILLNCCLSVPRLGSWWMWSSRSVLANSSHVVSFPSGAAHI